MTTATITEASTSKYLQAGGIKLHYNEAGSGPAVIMLHGSGPGASGWSNFQRNIAAFATKHRVILLDQPSYGKSDSQTMTEPRFLVNARALHDAMDALGIEKASLIGNSMGAGVALEFVVEHPERVEKLVLMGGGAFGESLYTPWPSEGIKVLNRGFEEPTLANLRALVNIMVYDASFLTDELLQQRYNAANNPGHLEAWRNSSTAMRNIGHLLPNVPHETLIIHGREDRVVPLEVGLRTLGLLPNAHMHIFSKCGHWAQFEKHEEFNELVMNFLAQQ